ncbi:thiol-disulfide oxidoreductase DCC family protein [Pseudobdellovibrio exovorus]|uniref:Thiol-disulfide oxidoreductase DCC n=1 Tax=Pseudobdellovibrio exovorus JSS TaxID=1184267 RepID=M4VAY2_9BACT|nr:DCC1-like thiol-disulfide oxidoreductase family protein [Pseudobdellovibrio exovorus]AGH95630.1 hypothetical protein A11Q_1414 [Pseudobdellovibrio exovorus JSS]
MERIIFFDGICPLCNRFIKIVQRLDRKKVFRFSSLQSKTAAQKLTKITDTSDPLSLNSVVYFQDGQYYTQSEALYQILNNLAGPWKAIARVFKTLPKNWRDRIYLYVADNRYRWFGKLESCPLPSAKEKEFYLE